MIGGGPVWTRNGMIAVPPVYFTVRLKFTVNAHGALLAIVNKNGVAFTAEPPGTTVG
jgi:hypothetical protein